MSITVENLSFSARNSKTFFTLSTFVCHLSYGLHFHTTQLNKQRVYAADKVQGGLCETGK